MLANRLSRNKTISILIIEAGAMFGPLSTVPLLAVAMQKSHVDWSFESVAQKYSSYGAVNRV